MHLKSLTLRQFRNYLSLEVDFSPTLNLFLGPNGSGKSNLLEAVSVLATSQSHRGSEPKSFPTRDKGEFALKGVFEGEEILTVETRQQRGRPRQTFVNGRLQRRLRDWIGRIPVVSFSPDDLAFVKGEPSFRRRALNEILVQIDPDYAETLQRFNKVLQERNAALRQMQEGPKDPTFLDPWDVALLKDGLFLSYARRDFLRSFSPRVQSFHQRLSAPDETIQLRYQPSMRLSTDQSSDVDENRRHLQELREAEIAIGSTLSGPHRDDIELMINDVAAKNYASQGQQRTLTLAAKLAEFEYLSEKLKRKPICLLDDMLSELDPRRRANVASSMMSEAQCLISLTALSDWPEGRPFFQAEGSRVFEVKNGTAKEENG